MGSYIANLNTWSNNSAHKDSTVLEFLLKIELKL